MNEEVLLEIPFVEASPDHGSISFVTFDNIEDQLRSIGAISEGDTVYKIEITKSGVILKHGK